MRAKLILFGTLLLVCSGFSYALVIDWVTVGNAGNANDDTGYGGVSYVYQISTYEVTAGQYTEFLNAVAATDSHGLYNTNMWSNGYGCKIQQNGSSGSYTYSVALDYANRPVNYVGWYDALRFCNWLHNSQGTGDTEDGAYDMSLGDSVVRKAGEVCLPSEDEWYKAAYHKNDGITGNYFVYPTSSDMAPGYVNNSWNLSGTGTPFAEGGIDPGNYATYDGDSGAGGLGGPYYRTEIGEWENSDSPYGTFDMGGNVWEWNETLISTQFSSYRGYRGGECFGPDGQLSSSLRNYQIPTGEGMGLGFRVASISEPTNSPPVADAGDDQIVYICKDGAAEVELDGSGSADADGDELDYLWTWEIEGTLFDANGVSPIIELPIGLHTVDLTVDDGVEVSEPNSCVIEVIAGIEVDLRVLPRVINRKNRMKRILAVVQLPAGIDGDDIDGSFLLYPGEIKSSFRRLMTVNGSQKLFMGFDKSELMAAVPGNGSVVLEIEARLISGRCLYGTDRIKIIRRGQGPKEQIGK